MLQTVVAVAELGVEVIFLPDLSWLLLARVFPLESILIRSLALGSCVFEHELPILLSWPYSKAFSAPGGKKSLTLGIFLGGCVWDLAGKSWGLTLQWLYGFEVTEIFHWVSKAQEIMKLEIEGVSGISLCPQWACAKEASPAPHLSSGQCLQPGPLGWREDFLNVFYIWISKKQTRHCGVWSPCHVKKCSVTSFDFI